MVRLLLLVMRVMVLLLRLVMMLRLLLVLLLLLLLLLLRLLLLLVMVMVVMVLLLRVTQVLAERRFAVVDVSVTLRDVMMGVGVHVRWRGFLVVVVVSVICRTTVLAGSRSRAA